MKTALIIPARYGSTRFPGKPLAMIAGKTMLQRVFELAEHATEDFDNVDILVATEDERIFEHATHIGAKAVMTPDTCKTGTDRAAAAIDAAGLTPDVVLNLQGDAPLTPPHFISDIIMAFDDRPMPDVVTPAYQLSWQQLDDLRKSKRTTPFSGTTVTVKDDGFALWFSKNIIPAIRGEDQLRTQKLLSPVLKHIGLYGYKYDVLKAFVTLEQSPYEKLEGLEQLRLLENGYTIKVVTIDPQGSPIHGGIDSPEDIEAAENILKDIAEPYHE
jgi:3-deoxy-manno-octulosonate cytidylyltransferase (CMP-KDO synthetase)|tara:strand:+ start:487 stop:1302 length:816 start_codon:yes stop_codon:yes gene_type:complete